MGLVSSFMFSTVTDVVGIRSVVSFAVFFSPHFCSPFFGFISYFLRFQTNSSSGFVALPFYLHSSALCTLWRASSVGFFAVNAVLNAVRTVEAAVALSASRSPLRCRGCCRAYCRGCGPVSARITGQLSPQLSGAVSALTGQLKEGMREGKGTVPPHYCVCCSSFLQILASVS